MKKALAVLVLALAGCPKRVVVVNGQELPVAQADDLARKDLEATRAATAGLPPAERAARLEALAARYRGVETSATALHEAAQAWREAKRPDKAAQDLGTLLTENPLYPRAAEAKYLLALVQLDQG